MANDYNRDVLPFQDVFPDHQPGIYNNLIKPKKQMSASAADLIIF
jgi:hypothetical protein